MFIRFSYSKELSKYLSHYWILFPRVNCSLLFCLPHKHNQHPENTLWNTGCEYPGVPQTKVCCVYTQYQKAHIQKRLLKAGYCNDGFVYKSRNTHAKTARWVAGEVLFAVCLYSNISFMHCWTETLCVVHLGPACWADGRSVLLVVFLTSFFNTGRCCL